MSSIFDYNAAQDRKATIKRIRELDYNIRRRMKRLKNSPGYAEAGYDVYKGMMEKALAANKKRGGKGTLTDLSDAKLKSLLSQLKYTDALKTSRQKGIKEFHKVIDPFKESYDRLDQTSRKKFNRMMGDLYEYAPWLEKYRYQLRDDLLVEFHRGDVDMDELTTNLLQKYEEAEYGIPWPDEYRPTDAPVFSEVDWDTVELDDGWI